MNQAVARSRLAPGRIRDVLATECRDPSILTRDELPAVLAALAVSGPSTLVDELIATFGAPTSPARGTASDQQVAATSSSSSAAKYERIGGDDAVDSSKFEAWVATVPVSDTMTQSPAVASSKRATFSDTLVEESTDRPLSSSAPVATSALRESPSTSVKAVPATPQEESSTSVANEADVASPVGSLPSPAATPAAGDDPASDDDAAAGQPAAGLPTFDGPLTRLEKRESQKRLKGKQREATTQEAEPTPAVAATTSGVQRKPGDFVPLAERLEAVLGQYSAEMDEAEATASLNQADAAALTERVERWESIVNRGIDHLVRDLISAAENDPDVPSHVLLHKLQHRAHEDFAMGGDGSSSSFLSGSVASTTRSAAGSGKAGMRKAAAVEAKKKNNPLIPFVSTLAATHLGRTPAYVWTVPGAVLVVDISGFQNIAHALFKFDPYELSRVLNVYLGKLISVVKHAGGDVVKFIGDRFVAVWNQQRDPSRLLRAAIATGLEILEGLGSHPVPPFGQFGVHLGVAVGDVVSRLLMPPNSNTGTAMPSAYHFVGGAAIAEATRMCRVASRGELCATAPCLAGYHRSADNGGAYPLSTEPKKAGFESLAAVVAADEAEADAKKSGLKLAPAAVDTSAVHIVQSMPPAVAASAAAKPEDADDEHDDDKEVPAVATAAPGEQSTSKRPKKEPKYRIDRGRLGHFLKALERPLIAHAAHPWFRRQGNPLAACVKPATRVDDVKSLGVAVDEMLFVPPRISEQIAFGTNPLLLTQVRDLIVLFIRMGDSQADAAHADSDPAVWFTEVHAVLRDHGCAVVQVIDDDKGVHVVAAFNLYTINGDAAERCIDAVTLLRRRRSDSFIAAATGNVLCCVVGHTHACQYDITGIPVGRACELMTYAVTTGTPIVLDESVYDLAKDRSTVMRIDCDTPCRVDSGERTATPYTIVPDRTMQHHAAASDSIPSASVSVVVPQGENSSRALSQLFAGAGGSGASTTTTSGGRHQATDAAVSLTPNGVRPLGIGGSDAAAGAGDVRRPSAGLGTPASALPSDLKRSPAPGVDALAMSRLPGAGETLKPPVLHFAHTLSKFVLVDQVNAIREVLSNGTPHSKKRTVVVRGPPATGKFGVILNALEGTGFVPLVHTAVEGSHDLELLESVATWFAASINRRVAAVARAVLADLEAHRLTAAFNTGVDLIRSVVSRKLRVAIIVRRSQYLDDGSANFLRVLHNQFGTAPTLALLLTTSPIVTNALTHAIFAVPPDDIDEQDNAALSATDGATHVYVETVPRDEAAAIVCHCMKGRVEEETVDWIFAKSAGALGWIVELCGYLQARGHLAPTSKDTVEVRERVRTTLNQTLWTAIAPTLTSKLMELVDQLDPTLLMMCKIVAAITEQPGISAFYYSVNRAAQVMVGRDMDVDDIKYMQKLYLLRECEHKCTAHTGNGELDAAMFFFPPMRDVVAGLLTAKQRTEINAVCADAYADTHPMNHPMQYLVRARHYLFCEDRDQYENDIERGWRMIDSDARFNGAEGVRLRGVYIGWMDAMPADRCEAFMANSDDFKSWKAATRSKRSRTASGAPSSHRASLAPQPYSNSTGLSVSDRKHLSLSENPMVSSPSGLAMSTDRAEAASGSATGGKSRESDVHSPESATPASSLAVVAAAADAASPTGQIIAIANKPKALAIGPARDYLDQVLNELLALAEALRSSKTRVEEHVAHALNAAARAGSDSDHDEIAPASPGDATPTIPASLVQRYKNALSDYKIILKGQSHPMEPDPDDTNAARTGEQDMHNVEVKQVLERVIDSIGAHLKSDTLRPRFVRVLQSPATSETVAAGQQLLDSALTLITHHYKEDIPRLQRLFESHQRSALFNSVRVDGAAITSRTEDAVGPKVYHVKRVERVRSEDEVADGIAHAVDAFAASGDELTSDTSTLVVLYGHLPQVLDAYCRSSRRLRDSFVEGLRGFYESMFAMESVRRRTREEFFVFLALWVSCCREREC